MIWPLFLLMGVPASLLQWHFQNMNVFQWTKQNFWKNNFRKHQVLKAVAKMVSNGK